MKYAAEMAFGGLINVRNDIEIDWGGQKLLRVDTHTHTHAHTRQGDLTSLL
jgi:hypothetical protein